MKKVFQLIIAILFFSISVKAQIIINGKSTYRPYDNYIKSGISISYGAIFWHDAKQEDLPGYSKGQDEFIDGIFFSGFSKFNISGTVNLGFEKGLSERFSIKNNLSFGKLTTGILTRSDLVGTDKSKVFQLSTYGNVILSNPDNKFKVNFLFGPEFMLVDKDVIIHDYVINDEDVPDDYNVKETIFEVGLTAGFGFSYDFGRHIAIFSEGAIGVSLPGGGLKISSSTVGLKYIF